MIIQDKQLQEFIADSGLVSKTDLDAIAKEAGEKGQSLSDMLISKGKMTEDDLRRTKAYILGVPFVSLKDEKIPFEVLSLIPEPIARKNNVIAYKKNPDSLEVAMLDVGDLVSLDFIKKKVGVKLLVRLTDGDSIKNSLLQYQKSLKAEFGDLIQQDAQTLKMSAEGCG
jgi:hypothetical protein